MVRWQYLFPFFPCLLTLRFSNSLWLGKERPGIVLRLVLNQLQSFNISIHIQAQLGLNHQNIVYNATSIPFYSGIPLIDVLTATNYHIALAGMHKVNNLHCIFMKYWCNTVANGSAFGCGLQYYGQFAAGYASTSAIKTPILCPSLNTSLDISLPGTSCNANMSILLSDYVPSGFSFKYQVVCLVWHSQIRIYLVGQT